MRKILVLVSLVTLIVALAGTYVFYRNQPATAQTQTVTFEATTEASPKPVITCAGITKKNERCKRRVKKQGDYCWQHKSQAK